MIQKEEPVRFYFDLRESDAIELTKRETNAIAFTTDTKRIVFDGNVVRGMKELPACMKLRYVEKVEDLPKCAHQLMSDDSRETLRRVAANNSEYELETTGFVVDETKHLYMWAHGEGDTLDGLYQDLGAFGSGAGGKEEVFIAKYGVTTYEEVNEAYEAGKLVVAAFGEGFAPLSAITDAATFTHFSDKEKVDLHLHKNNTWSYGESRLLFSDELSQEIDESDVAAPSCKAVKEYVDSKGKPVTILRDIVSGVQIQQTSATSIDYVVWDKVAMVLLGCKIGMPFKYYINWYGANAYGTWQENRWVVFEGGIYLADNKLYIGRNGALIPTSSESALKQFAVGVDKIGTYNASVEVTNGRGAMIKIEYNHGEDGRSLEPKLVWYASEHPGETWYQPVRYAYIDPNRGGNPPEFIPYRYGERTPVLYGSGTIYIYVDFADEPDTYLENKMDCWVNLEAAESSKDIDDSSRVMGRPFHLEVLKQNIVFEDTHIKCVADSYSAGYSYENGKPLVFWTNSGKLISYITIMSGYDRPFVRVRKEGAATYLDQISNYTIPGSGAQKVTIEWEADAYDGSRETMCNINMEGVTYKIPFYEEGTQHDSVNKRISDIEAELEKLKAKFV